MNLPDWPFSLAWLFGCPLAISWVLTAILIRWAPRLGLVDYPSDRKVHTRPTPRGGGLAIFLAVLASSSLLTIFHFQLLLAAAIVLLGLFDDLRPLPWQVRLLVQFGVSLLAVLFCLPPASWPIRAAAVVWIAGLINAFNMLDNMDALSGGVAWIAAGFLATTGVPPVAEWGPFILLMGALSGFLWFNRPPARLFMGDAGSTFLGFTLGLGSVQVALREGGPPWSPAVPLCILAVPCYDLFSVVLLRLSQGRSPFHADKQHLSHRLVGRGLSGWTAVRVIYLLALASGASGLILYAVATWTAAGLVVGQLGVWWIALAVTEFATKESCHVAQIQNNAGPNSGSAGS
ncbi:MAG TPA: MraY family glycosyltransferase [Gemmataceae bacterium]|jgi:UDP-GlcNAc:undecaprenyl-phosphate GlcNAc-1-phosphate transferase